MPSDKSLKSSARGEAGFETHFAKIYGERWGALRAALGAPEELIRRPNIFAGVTEFSASGPAVRGPEGLLDVYVMDPASVAAALKLIASQFRIPILVTNHITGRLSSDRAGTFPFSRVVCRCLPSFICVSSFLFGASFLFSFSFFLLFSRLMSSC